MTASYSFNIIEIVNHIIDYQGLRDCVENRQTDKQTRDNRDQQTNIQTDHRQPRQAIAQPSKQRALAQNEKQSVAENPQSR